MSTIGVLDTIVDTGTIDTKNDLMTDVMKDLMKDPIMIIKDVFVMYTTVVWVLWELLILWLLWVLLIQ